MFTWQRLAWRNVSFLRRCPIKNYSSSEHDEVSRVLHLVRLQRDLLSGSLKREHRASPVFLEPGELVDLLADTAQRPSTAAALHCQQGPLETQIFCSETAFNGNVQRRQFFRNQVLRLYLENSLAIMKMTQHLAMYKDGQLPEFEDYLLRWQGAATIVHPSNEPDVAVMVDVLLDTEDEELPEEFGKGDVFFLIQSTNPVAPCRGEIELSVTAPSQASDSTIFVGTVLKKSARQGDPVALLRLLLRPVDVGSLVLEGGDCEVVPLEFPMVVLKRQEKAILALCNFEERYTEVVSNLVFTEVFREATVASEVTRGAALQSSSFLKHLNPLQLAAVLEAMSPQPVTLVQGPPGTGKTMVAVAIVRAWLYQDPTTPILVATGTHASKNIIARKLEENGLILSNRFDVRKKKRQREKGSVPVYVETVFMACIPEGRKLPRVILDESAQVTLAAALISLGQGCTKMVLIGDPKQLGPVSPLEHSGLSNSPLLAPYRNELDSLFEYVQKRHQFAPTLLCEQYRMDPRIRAYPSSWFYHDALIDAECTRDLQSRLLPQDFPLPEDECLQISFPFDGCCSHPIAFIDTDKIDFAEEQLVFHHGGYSWQNRAEAGLVCQVVHHLINGGIRPEDIGIISAYGAQRELVFEVLHGKKLDQEDETAQRFARYLVSDGGKQTQTPHPNIHTVDGFQGSERDFIVFSAVRSNSEGKVGFLDDSKRMCVLLTRARRGFIVIGNSSTLVHSHEWAVWLEQAVKLWIHPDPEVITARFGKKDDAD